MRVIKLGGSLLQNAHLPVCLAHIAESQTPTLVVAGGGGFADQVRLAQQRWQFNDVAAHHMAILAMQQMALLMNALQPEWALWSSLADMRSWQAKQQVALWFPDITLLNQQGIPASWTVTSDSLAAWLAGILGATDLIIVKAAAVAVTASAAQLVEQGVLDQAFLTYSQHARYSVTVMNSHDFLDKTLP